MLFSKAIKYYLKCKLWVTDKTSEVAEQCVEKGEEGEEGDKVSCDIQDQRDCVGGTVGCCFNGIQLLPIHHEKKYDYHSNMNHILV